MFPIVLGGLTVHSLGDVSSLIRSIGVYLHVMTVVYDCSF